MPGDETSEVFLNDDGRFLLLDEVLHGKVATDQRLEDNDAAPQVVVLGSGFEASPRRLYDNSGGFALQQHPPIGPSCQPASGEFLEEDRCLFLPPEPRDSEPHSNQRLDFDDSLAVSQELSPGNERLPVALNDNGRALPLVLASDQGSLELLTSLVAPPVLGDDDGSQLLRSVLLSGQVHLDQRLNFHDFDLGLPEPRLRHVGLPVFLDCDGSFVPGLFSLLQNSQVVLSSDKPSPDLLDFDCRPHPGEQGSGLMSAPC